MRFILWLLLAGFSAFLNVEHAVAQSQTARVEASQVSLVSSHKVIQSGVPFELGILISLDDHWHTYWKNAGDTGFPAQVRWHLPDNSTIAETQWPAPEKMVIENTLVNYVYEGQLLLAYDTVLKGEVGQRIPIKADVSWLMCADVCIPGIATIETELLVGETAMVDEGLSPLFSQTKQNIPTPFTGEVTALQEGSGYQLSFPLKEGVEAVFIPDAEGVIIDIRPQNLMVKDGRGYIVLEKDTYGEEQDDLTGLLQIKEGGKVKSFTISALIEPGKIAMPAPETVATVEDITFITAIIFAFIAGIILNLMPCVLPVLFLKVTGLVHHAHGKYEKAHLFSFLMGVLVPFWILGAMLIVFKQSGEVLGWGFHLQSPAFVGLLTIFILLISLNLFGVFEIGNTVAAKAGSKVRKTEGHGGSFASGILMTLVATPCTVPFMGGAVAYGLSSGIGVALAVFTSLGVGMAAPYMLVALSPKLLKYIPKPGAWMVTFRKILGIPMLLTAIWLLWVFRNQVEHYSLDAFGASLVVVILVSWLFGIFTKLSASNMRRRVGTFIMAAALVVSGYFAISAEELAEVDMGHDMWQPWSQEAVEDAVVNGETVFVDFTADWCITCKFMEATVLETRSVQALFNRYNAVLFKADWTLKDPVITEALASFGRKGVPLYVLYKNGEVQILPQLLTYGVLEEALSR